MKSVSQQCVYCGVQPGTTSDHVPPDQMFPDPKPSNLITVPACSECNKGFQKDEDYFRGLFSLTGAPIEHDAPEFWKKVGRGLQRSLALKKTIADSLRGGTMVNPDGEEVGRWIKVEDNWHRIVSLIAKCVRGLYFFETSVALSPSIEIECPQFADGPIDLGTLYALTYHGKRGWPGVFEYRYRVAAYAPTASAWILTFYSTCVYTAFTGRVCIDQLQNKEPETTR
jgi:hypothetical protein